MHIFITKLRTSFLQYMAANLACLAEWAINYLDL